jgi:hypothetical protein
MVMNWPKHVVWYWLEYTFFIPTSCVIDYPSSYIFSTRTTGMTFLKICSVTTIVFTDICMFYFSILVSADPQKCSLVWCTSKHAAAHKPMLYSQHLNLILISLFVANTHGTKFFSTALSQCLLCLFQVFLVGSWMELVFLVFWSKN